MVISLGGTSCKDEVVTPVVELPEQSEDAINIIGEYNKSIEVFQLISEGKTEVVDVREDGTITFDNKTEAVIYSSSGEIDKDIPIFGIDESGYWIYSLNGETSPLTGLSGEQVAAISSAGVGVVTPMVGISKDGYWQVSFNGAQWKKLSDVIVPSLNEKTIENYSLFKSSFC